MDDLQKTWMSKPKKYNHIFEKIDSFVQTQNLLPKDDSTIVVACSGGPDSVFLAEYIAYLAAREKYTVILAYFDHEWRDESKQEVMFCASLAKKHQFLFETATLSSFRQSSKKQRKYNGSKEELARHFRYEFLHEITKKHSASAIMLGHHADDQIETFLIRLIRGSSLTGLCGMKARDGLLVRPLLFLQKEEILNYMQQNNMSYCIDYSNENLNFLRNRIRAVALPALNQVDNRFTQNCLALINRLNRAEECLALQTETVYKSVISINNDRHDICIKQFLQLHEELQYRILLRWLVTQKIKIVVTESLFNEIRRFLTNNKSETHQINNMFLIEKRVDYCVFCKTKTFLASLKKHII